MRNMGWISRVAVLVMLRYISLSSGIPHSLPVAQDGYMEENAVSSDVDSNIVPPADIRPSLQEEEEDDGKLQQITNYLTYVLLRPWPVTGLPLLYVEDEPANARFQEPEGGMSEIDGNFEMDNEVMRQMPYKRSRYYRKYPWKRQNSRETYEAENRYLCQPSKDDVFRLLVALHEARQGNRGHTIHFCNRKRPASAIFTNIRFLGKRK